MLKCQRMRDRSKYEQASALLQQKPRTLEITINK